MTQQQWVYNLSFSADTSQAKAALVDLKSQLNSIVQNPVKIGDTMTADIQKATQAAADLQIHLQKATNVKTGNLDFGKFNQSLKNSKTSLTDYARQLQSLGPSGQQAFMALANSVATSEVPIKRANNALSGMLTTLKNTAKWQISSSLLHGFMGTIQKAYGYAQDLNKSLNDIRIVSGASVDQMSKFAKEANNAAKALSTTTNEYAKASLIYYQQGLSDEEVAARTEVTIKMANAAGESAVKVSDQLTAVWNNFYDGTKSLEYYADVMTALGAATASSTDEIAGGLEKFAAIGETIGLSYEYAASALATITSNTRQSEEVVGTALKTIFARIQGLKLGETLEDGTSLNKYSEALQKVGISIFDSTGELKKMDNILDEMASKWQTLEKDQQVALAQTVAGVRQYTQLVSLMDNWNKGDSDSMVANLKTSYNSTGELSKQAEIYAESWEAAQKRVQASLEEIYGNLIDDKFFIGLTNAFSDLLDLFGTFTDGIGGLGGLLSGLGLIATKVFKNQIAQGFRDMVYNMQMSSSVGIKMIQDQKAAQMKEMSSLMAVGDGASQTDSITKKVYQQELSLQSELIDNANKMTDEEYNRYTILLKQHKALGEQSIELTKQYEQIKEQSGAISTNVIGEGMLQGQDFETMRAGMEEIRNMAVNSVSFEGFLGVQDDLGVMELTKNNIEQITYKLQQLGATDDEVKEITSALNDLGKEGSDTSQSMEELRARLQEISKASFDKFVNSLKEMGMTDDELKEISNAFELIQAQSDEAGVSIEKVGAILSKTTGIKVKNVLSQMGLKEGTAAYDAMNKKLMEYFQLAQKSETVDRQRKVNNENLTRTYHSLKDAISGVAKQQVQDWANHLTTVTSSLMSAGMLVSSINSLINTIEDPDASGWERFGSILTSVSMVVMSLSGTFKGLKSAWALLKSMKDKDTLATIANTAAAYIQEKGTFKLTGLKKAEAEAVEDHTEELNKNTAAKVANSAADKLDTDGDVIPDSPIEFKGKDGRTRTYSGKKVLEGKNKGKLLDDNDNIIADKFVNKYNLKGGGPKSPQAPNVGAGAAGKGAGAAGAGSGGLASGTLSTLGAAAASVAVIAAAIAAAAVMIKLGVDAMNSAEDAFATASLTAQDLSNAATAAQSSLQGLKTSFDELSGKRDALDGLTEGTLEYKMALQESNKAVLDLIMSNDKLTMDDLDYDDKTGAYKIKEESQKKLLEDQMKEVSSKQASAMYAQAEKQDKQQAVEVDSFLEKQHKGSMIATTLQTAGAFAAGGAIAGTAIPGIGNAVGAVAGAIVGAGAGIGLALTATASEIDSQAEAFDNIEFDELGTEAEKLAKAAEAFGLDVNNLDNTTKEQILALIANKEATDKNTEALLIAANKEAYAEEFAGLTESEKELAAQGMGTTTKDTSDAVKAQLLDRWETKLHGSEYDEAAALLGYEEGTEIKAIKGEDGVTRYNAVNAAGETVEELGTLDAIATRVADEYATSAARGDSKAMERYTEELAVDALGTDSLTAFDANYVAGTNRAAQTANKFDFNLTGQAEALLNSGVESENLTAEDFEKDTDGNIIKGIQAIADASGELDTKFYEENKDAVNAYYRALFGKDIGSDSKEIEAALGKLNELKEESAKQSKEDSKTQADNIAQEAVTEGLIESKEAFEAYTESMLTAEQKSKLTKEEQAKLAKQLLSTQSGLKTAAKGLDAYNEALEANDEIAKSNAISEIAKGLNDAFGEGSFDADLVADKMDVIKKAIAGNKGAIAELQAIAAEQYLIDIGVNLDDGLGEQINNWIDSQEFKDLKVGTTLDDTGMTSTFQKMLDDGQITVDQLNTLFEEKLGFTPEISYQTIELTAENTSKTDTGYDVAYMDPNTGQEATKHITAEQYNEAMTAGFIQVPVINGKNTTKTATPTQITKGLNTNTGKGSGSKKEPKKVEAKKKDDIIERYKETEDAIDDVRDAYDDASKAADRLYGAGRIAAMMKANKELKKETELLKKKRKEAEAYLKLDKVALDKAAADVGVNLQYDADGNIINYTEELDRLATEHEQKAAELNAKPGGPSDEEVEKFEEEKEKIDELTAAMEKYEDTRQTIRDTDNAIRDNDYEWQDNNYEMWSHSLEISLDITGDAKELLDALLSRTEGDFYRQAEGLSIMFGQLALTNAEMGTYIGHLGVLGGLMATQSISPQAFIEGLNQIQEGAMNAAAALYELDQQMIEYYGNALSMAREELDVYTDRMEHCTSVLEHYLSLLDLMGQQQDYKSRGIILAGRVETIANELDVIQEEADYMMQQAESKKRLLNTVGLIPGAADVLKQQYEDALSAATETQEEFLAKAEEYAQALNDQLENTLNQYGQELEAALTGGKGFELMTSEMEHMVSLQEEYLTETNKIYETEKLMNKAQQDIDKSTNTVAKRKLKQFIEETNLLKEKTELSKFELDIQQAKYELLLAEIALEEAQQSKSQVRLQRDSSGNFGYIYTAEAEEIAKTEQELADKRNELYNISLEGINNYAEKTIQLQQEMFDKLQEMEEKYQNGEYASLEAYQAAREETIRYYNQKIRQTSSLFHTAMQQDSNATADSWGKNYADMIDSSDEWESEVTKHVAKVDKAFLTWNTSMDLLAQRTGASMDQLASSVKSVTNESDDLLHEITDPGGVLDQIKIEMGLVSALTTLYASLRWAVMAAAAAYTALAAALMMVSAASAMAAGVGAILDSDAVKGATNAVGGAISDAASKSSSGTKSSNSSSSGNSSSSSKTVKAKNGAQIFESSTDTSGVKPYFDSNTNYTVLGEYGDRVAVRVEGANSGTTGFFYKKDLVGYATGGYTGEWGSYGKLAMLHEKELVLNADDTKNFLASMDLLDSIISTIDLHAANQQLGGALSSPGMSNIGGDTLEQTVTIEANFPNVSSRIEIEEAFSTLVNRASQYANRK